MAESSGADAAKKELVRKPPIETASWCYRDKEDKFFVTVHGMELEWQLQYSLFLLETGTFSDVTIRCEGVELSCHKVILGAR